MTTSASVDGQHRARDRRQQDREHQPRLAAAPPGVLGQPARDHVPHTLADVHGVVADPLVVAPDEGELHRRLDVAHVARSSSRIAWM